MSLWKTVWRYFRQLKIELPYDPAIPFQGVCVCVCVYEENENTNLKRYVYPSVHCSIVYNSQDTETTSVSSTDEWIKMYTYTYTHTYTYIHTYTHTHKMEYYSAIKKNEIPPLETM